jgi:hypothetical protein
LQAWVRSGLRISGKSDGGGLTFTLSSKGAASWVFRYRLLGKGREYTIGSYPDISLASARKIATKLRAEVDTGTDVAAEKQKLALSSRQAQSFKQLSDAYLPSSTVQGQKQRFSAGAPRNHAGFRAFSVKGG